ncbi:MAG: acetyltransferase [Flavobacteriales bacterium]|jgi:sugar O-acyltransferase (sialic acid O-acetyltransferase NeuD family)|nr:acetyltransferase [Flavobacteriales bacterium]
MKTITLYGAGGHCYAAAALIKSVGGFEPTAVWDDAPKERAILDIPVMQYKGAEIKSDALCVTIGNNRVRKEIVAKFDTVYPTFIHASATVYPSVTIGEGTLVHPNSVLDAGVTVGNYCIINNNATVSHNVHIADFVHVAIQAAVAGGVRIGEGTLVGAGSVILPELTIGKWVTIGAGAVVTKDVPDNSVVYGNPAVIRSNTN